MTTATLVRPSFTADVDNRLAYAGFGFAYLAGHGATAISQGPDPLVQLPGWLPTTLLAGGVVAGSVAAGVAATRAQRGGSGAEARTGKLLGTSWITAFVALFLAITGLTATLDLPELQTVLWPAGSGLVVGLLYLGEGAARRNSLHYALGSWLALVSAAALFLATPGPFWVLTVAGGGAYVIATVLETRRLAR